MRPLPDLLRSLRPMPTRALFLAFDASPPFIDHEVFPALLSDRLEDVTIIVDERRCVRATSIRAARERLEFSTKYAVSDGSAEVSSVQSSRASPAIQGFMSSSVVPT